ncbi:hypothetical protein [Lewinella sp. 4G2]|uniref:hypothetical protein n=1 Tax=Lewinella sp. 4G2 TaxID=1803372 RepID=UPI0007B48488|nr:hypothetical protein [Lewinella sp. 4G2]OAV42674.1 hypothetical protein A3850_015645 [Lewinella sp. 4G2]
MKNDLYRYIFYFAASLVVIFLVAYFTGMADNYYLRFTNGFAHIVVLYYGIKNLRLRQPETVNNYVSGVARGMSIGAAGSLVFGLFILLFMLGNPALVAELQATTNIGARLTPWAMALIIFAEGVAVSLIGSYLLVRYVDARLEAKNIGANYANRGALS